MGLINSQIGGACFVSFGAGAVIRSQAWGTGVVILPVLNGTAALLNPPMSFRVFHVFLHVAVSSAVSDRVSSFVEQRFRICVVEPQGT